MGLTSKKIWGLNVFLWCTIKTRKRMMVFYANKKRMKHVFCERRLANGHMLIWSDGVCIHEPRTLYYGYMHVSRGMMTPSGVYLLETKKWFVENVPL
jgi:hypothetical protein